MLFVSVFTFAILLAAFGMVVFRPQPSQLRNLMLAFLVFLLIRQAAEVAAVAASRSMELPRVLVIVADLLISVALVVIVWIGKDTQQQLAESERRYSTVVGALSEGVMLFDSETNVIAHNESAGKIFRLSADQLEERTLDEGQWTAIREDETPYPPEEYPVVVTLRSGEPQVNKILGVRRGDGQFSWISVNTQPLFRNGEDVPYGAVASFADISEQRKVEAKLRERELMFREIFENAAVGMVMTSPDRTIQFVNHRLAAILNTTPQALKDRNLTYFVDDAEQLNVDEQGEDSLRKGLTTQKWRSSDGRPVWVSLGRTVLTDSRGKASSVLYSVQDITAQRTAEAELERQQQQMSHMGRLLSMSEMVAGIAHEVSQPLYAIANYAKACVNVLEDDSPPNLHDVRHWNEQIDVCATAAGEIINRLRAFVKDQPSTRRWSDVADIVNVAMTIVHSQAQRARIRLEQTVPESLPKVHVDPVQIQQVLVNLLANAIEAIENSSTPNPLVRLVVQRDGDTLDIRVEDNGPGFDSYDGELFQPFKTTKSTGMGLGLAISNTIMRAHHGDLRAAKNRSGGATVHLSLPVES